MTRKTALDALLKAAPLAAGLAAWQLVCQGQPSREFYFGTPLRVLETLVRDTKNGSLLVHTAVTGGEALAGFVLGNLIGVIAGLSLWYFPAAAKLAKPYFVALGSIPIFALAPITIIWFGVGIPAKIALAFLGTVFVAAAQVHRGAEETDPLLIQRLRIFGATPWQLFRVVIVPSATTWMIASLRMTISLALLGAFIGEFIAADRGLGYTIVRAAGLFDTPRVFGGILVIVGLAMGFDVAVDALEARLLKWRARDEPRVGPTTR